MGKCKNNEQEVFHNGALSKVKIKAGHLTLQIEGFSATLLFTFLDWHVLKIWICAAVKPNAFGRLFSPEFLLIMLDFDGI